jgi:nitrite reductase (cytochrome c-552)
MTLYQGKSYDPLASGVNPVGCANCHDTETMQLRVANPYALRAIKKSGKDPDKLTGHERKSYVCAQCHFEYDKVSKNGVTTIEMNWELYGNLDKLAAFYDEQAAVSYTHPLSKAPLVKPMNNEAGLAMSGSHFKHGVACADCHFPKITEKGGTFTSHDNVRGSREIAASCLQCHADVGIEQLEKDVRIRMAQYGGENIRQLERSLAEIHLLIKQALDAGAAVEELAAIYADLRAAQWRWDYLLWQKGGAFHAPFETQKMLAEALVRANSAKASVFLLLSGLGARDVRIADFSTVEKAARILGLEAPGESAGEAYTFLKEPLEKAVKKGELDENIYRHTREKLFAPGGK